MSNEIFGVPYLKKGKGIHIKKKNRGKFTEYCGGEVTNECIQKAKRSGNSKLVKRAIFAQNARKWKHAQGGIIKCQEGTPEGGIQKSADLNWDDYTRLLKLKSKFVGEAASDDYLFEAFDFKKDISDVSNYFNSYLNSKGLQRILNNQDNWWTARHPYRKYYSNPDQGTREWLEAAKKVEPHRYTTNMYTTLSASYGVQGEPEDIIVVGDKPDTSDGYHFDPQFVMGHEYAHGKVPYLKYWLGRAGFSSKSAQTEALNQNTNTLPGHNSRNQEKHADQWGLKYLLYKEGIYDSREDKDITIDQVKELRKRFPDLRPVKQMTDEQLMFQLNNVADNSRNSTNKDNGTYYAKKGNKLRYLYGL